MSSRTVITLFVLATTVPVSAARADFVLTPVAAAILRTDPAQSPPDIRLEQPSSPSTLWVNRSVNWLYPPQPVYGAFEQAGMSFDLSSLSFLGPSTPDCRLVFYTNSAFSSVPFPNQWPTFNISYGIDSTMSFSKGTFFASSGPNGAVGVATIRGDMPPNPVITFDITAIVQNARSQPGNPYLKIWVNPPPGGGYWYFNPTLSVVPEPSTVLLMGIGVSALGLFGLKRRGRGRTA